ncbi:MAG: DUF2505 domain-containing protein [Propioniciclava sp.]|uniref:DUF2505 domain-containing protein n=1 Tax=Propioniciclava sp. TaxID=2038686 RepID=UPI0039E24292
MHLTSRHELPADPDAAFTMLTNEAFLSQAARASGARNIHALASATRTAVEATVDSPAAVRAFIGTELTFTQTITWGPREADGARTGNVTIDIKGAPASLGGTVRLAPTASGSSLDWDGEFTVSVPFVGPSVERAAAPMIEESLDVIGSQARVWLTR